ncbi:MAG: carboxypeptidase-like regulatory domain-containing protein [Bacteroidota bacterium]
MKKTILSIVFVAVFSLFSLATYAQGTLKGKVVDAETSETLIGTSVVQIGTTNGTVTDANGEFTLTLIEGSSKIEISFIGYVTQRIDVAGKQDLGTILLESSSISVEDIVVTGYGIIDLAGDRMTPIASTIVDRIEIQSKAVGNVEFPEVMKNTPNVYVANQAGGYGDAQMFMRGFDQSNTAFLLNGQPINGMEDGKMYWSNWAGMSDIANAVDIQRGLGSSKLAISSVGGTINIVTKATDKKKGGYVRLVGGNGAYMKGTIGYNTGVSENGWGVSMLVDYWQGDRKYAEGTKGKGQNYFLSIGKQMDSHNFNFMVFGAPQWHDQNFSKALGYSKYGYYDQDGSGGDDPTIDDISREEMRYNANWGYLDGEYMTWRRNFYHKPVMNLNWDWEISDESALSTVLYASYGRGGGTGAYGSSRQYLTYDENNQIDFSAIKANNQLADGGIGSYGSTAALRGSMNMHKWYGAVTNFNHEVNENFSFNVGADFRFYNGDHFRQLIDLLGLNGWEDGYGRYDGALDANGDYIVSNTYKANPWAALSNYAPEEDRIAYDNSEWINYQGVFGQAEYAGDGFSLFFQGAVSNQSYKKEERFSADHEQSETLNRIGFNLKGGGSVALAEGHTLFANLGYYSRQPFLDNIFEYGSIEKRGKEVENEKITGIELGYKAELGLRTNLNVNAYYTKWANRFQSASADEYTTPGGTVVSDAGIRMFNIGQLHKGLELELNTYITNAWSIRGYATAGDWKYSGSTPVEVLDMDNNGALVDEFDIDLTGTMVGEAPQVSAGLGTAYSISGFRIYADMNYYKKLYGFVDVEDMAVASLNNETYESEELGAYMLVDAGASYTIFKNGSNALIVRGNAYNLLNKKYFSRKDNYGYHFGNGTTFNFGLTLEF